MPKGSKRHEYIIEFVIIINTLLRLETRMRAKTTLPNEDRDFFLPMSCTLLD